jgi:hypothetical protein
MILIAAFKATAFKVHSCRQSNNSGLATLMIEVIRMKRRLAAAFVVTIGLLSAAHAQSQLQEKIDADNVIIRERANGMMDALEAMEREIASSKCSAESAKQFDDSVLKLNDFRQQQVPIALNDSVNPVQRGLARIAALDIKEIDEIIAKSLVHAADRALDVGCVDVADRYYRAVIGSSNLPDALLRRAQIGIDDVRARRGASR